MAGHSRRSFLGMTALGMTAALPALSAGETNQQHAEPGAACIPWMESGVRTSPFATSRSPSCRMNSRGINSGLRQRW